MRILIDTNILFSALLFPQSTPAKALLTAVNKHKIFLCEQNITEFLTIVARKAPNYSSSANTFLSELTYTKLPNIYHTKVSDVLIRDDKDQPILNAAVEYGIDIILTGDKDFLSLNLEQPKCLTAVEFLKMDSA